LGLVARGADGIDDQRALMGVHNRDRACGEIDLGIRVGRYFSNGFGDGPAAMLAAPADDVKVEQRFGLDRGILAIQP